MKIFNFFKRIKNIYKGYLSLVLVFVLCLLVLNQFTNIKNKWILSLNEFNLTFSSLESKDNQGRSVENTIRFISFPDKDVWMMNQIHWAEPGSVVNPDRLAIVIRRNSDNQSENQAFFYQLPSGRLEWQDDLVNIQIKSRVNCQMCHSNGPRLIRADTKFSIFDKKFWMINQMNRKILSYGLVRNMNTDDIHQFKFRKLSWKSCQSCHNGKHRAELTTQQFLTIKFLIKNKLMPPLEFNLRSDEIEKIERFFKTY